MSYWNYSRVDNRHKSTPSAASLKLPKWLKGLRVEVRVIDSVVTVEMCFNTRLREGKKQRGFQNL